jgi:hypothetical protein
MMNQLEKLHELSLVHWQVVITNRTSGESPSRHVLKDLSLEQAQELFGESESPLTLMQPQFDLLGAHLVNPIAWDSQLEYQLVRIQQDFSLNESSTSQGELEQGIAALFSLPETSGKWCILIIQPRLGDYEKHEESPLFMFPTEVWPDAVNVIRPFVEQYESVCFYLPKLKYFYMWAFVDANIIDGLETERLLVGERASMLVAKLAYWKPPA